MLHFALWVLLVSSIIGIIGSASTLVKSDDLQKRITNIVSLPLCGLYVWLAITLLWSGIV